LTQSFGAVPGHLRQRLEGLSTIDKLEALHDQAIDCPSLEAFQGLLGVS